eukprot:TRINITY_DN50097_c0_g1_i1.p2 TRINITY_DN50097_c0_g1~~TRINITY_DN50097_c0_g1_i1.p2  ORF type:complete len:135 (+),score=14.55 TRINITY_DN50097_c0_g1_i1:393-797(+)
MAAMSLIVRQKIMDFRTLRRQERHVQKREYQLTLDCQGKYIGTQTGIEQVKIQVNPEVKMDIMKQRFAPQILDMLDYACVSCEVADCGHRHSNGQSEVCFYIHCPAKTEVTGAVALYPDTRLTSHRTVTLEVVC